MIERCHETEWSANARWKIFRNWH